MASLVADVAQTWFELRVLDELLDITECNVKLQEDALTLAGSGCRAGSRRGSTSNRP